MPTLTSRQSAGGAASERGTTQVVYVNEKQGSVLSTHVTATQEQSKGKHYRYWVGLFLLRWVSAAGAGISALGLLRVLAPFLGFTVKMNMASCLLSAVLGAPGVVLLLLLRLVFGAG